LDREHSEDQLKNELMKSLEATNFILGDSEIVAARFTDSLQAEGMSPCHIQMFGRESTTFHLPRSQISTSAVTKVITTVPITPGASTSPVLTPASAKTVSSIRLTKLAAAASVISTLPL